MAKNQKTQKNPKTEGKWYQSFIVPGAIALIAIILVFVVVKGEVDRFTLIMPIFAGFILYNILTLPDEE